MSLKVHKHRASRTTTDVLPMSLKRKRQTKAVTIHKGNTPPQAAHPGERWKGYRVIHRKLSHNAEVLILQADGDWPNL